MKPLRAWIAGKIQNIRVTALHPDYHGSVTIGRDLLEAAGIRPYQKVDLINLNTGARWSTYVLPGPEGAFELNGGAARLGLPGDPCIVLAYVLAEDFPGAKVVFCDEANRIADVLTYPPYGSPA